MKIADIHSSDLTAACLRAVQLRHEGKIVAEYTSALYRGQLAGEVLRRVHEGRWAGDLSTAILDAHKAVEANAKAENRPITQAVEKNRTDTWAEVQKAVEFYRERFREYFARCKFIGCELPIRAEIDGRQFASHLDLLFRDPEGQLCVWDWKWRQDSPTFAYLARNLQLAMYTLSVRHGAVMLDDDWIEFGEWPRIAWVHLPNLMPYGRSGEWGKKGEHRPEEKIVRWLPAHSQWESKIRAEFALRGRMMEEDLWPTNPDPVGCELCESRMYCQPFVQIGSEQ